MDELTSDGLNDIRDWARNLLKRPRPAAYPWRRLTTAGVHSQSSWWRVAYRRAEAKAAVPALIDALKDEDKDVCTQAAGALKKIDPETARKAGVR